jgi:hypothetical protein
MEIRTTKLEEIVSLCESVAARSESASISSIRTLYAKSLFEKGMLNGSSIASLIQPLRQGKTADLGGICALARSLIEAHNVFMYLTESGISVSERDFRFQLMNLNSAVDLLRINDAIGVTTSEFPSFWQTVSKDWSLESLQKNDAFNGLDEKRRAELLKGKRPYLNRRGTRRAPVDEGTEAAVYNLFSHHVHSFGLSSQFGGSDTSAGYVNALFLAVEISVLFLANLVKQYQVVRTRATGSFSEPERGLITDALSLRHLERWKSKMKESVRM